MEATPEKFQEDFDDILPLTKSFCNRIINSNNPFIQQIHRDEIHMFVAQFYTEIKTFGKEEMIKRNIGK